MELNYTLDRVHKIVAMAQENYTDKVTATQTINEGKIYLLAFEE